MKFNLPTVACFAFLVSAKLAAEQNSESWLQKNIKKKTIAGTLVYARGQRQESNSQSEFLSVDRLSVPEGVGRKPGDVTPRKLKPKLEVDNLKLKRSSARRSCYKQYTMASMWAALERIEQGLSVYRASLEYGVPRKTLRNWMKKYNIMSYFDLRKQEREKHDVIVNLD